MPHVYNRRQKPTTNVLVRHVAPDGKSRTLFLSMELPWRNTKCHYCGFFRCPAAALLNRIGNSVQQHVDSDVPPVLPSFIGRIRSGIECLKQIVADERAAGKALPSVQSTK